jgi:hypothetical protein
VHPEPAPVSCSFGRRRRQDEAASRAGSNRWSLEVPRVSPTPEERLAVFHRLLNSLSAVKRTIPRQGADDEAAKRDCRTFLFQLWILNDGTQEDEFDVYTTTYVVKTRAGGSVWWGLALTGRPRLQSRAVERGRVARREGGARAPQGGGNERGTGERQKQQPRGRAWSLGILEWVAVADANRWDIRRCRRRKG